MSDEYVPTPVLYMGFDEEEQAFIIQTQNLILDKALNMKCYYTSDLENNEVYTWQEMEIEFCTNDYTHSINDNNEAYFYFKIPLVGAEDTTYRIVFYNYLSEKLSDVVTYEFIYEEAVEYIENDLGIKSNISVRLNILLNYFKERLGFVVYPFEFIGDFLNRILNIEYKEPIIRIPELTIPGTEEKVFNGYEYNFNDMLKNEAIANFYNIYLVVVDAIIIVGVIILAKNTFMEVVSK